MTTLASLLLNDLNPDYINLPFSGKQAQFEQVLDILDQTGFIPEPLIEAEATWFYRHLGIDDVFFARELPKGIAAHIHLLYLCKVQAFASSSATEQPVIRYKHEAADHAVFFDTAAGKSHYGEYIDEKFLDGSIGDAAYRMEYFSAPLEYEADPILRGVAERLKSSPEQAAAFSLQRVQCHFVYKTEHSAGHEGQEGQKRGIEASGDATFLKIALPRTKELYAEVVEAVMGATGPVIRHFALDELDEYRVVIGYRQKTLPHYTLALSDLADYYKLRTTRKYVEQFSCGVTVVSMYVAASKDGKAPLDLLIYQVIKEASLLYCVPHNYFHGLFVDKVLSLQEAIYAQCGVVFVTHFLNRLGPEYARLLLLLDALKLHQHAEVLGALKKRLRAETYTQDYIREVFGARADIVRKLYRQFADVHYVRLLMEKTLSYQRLSQTTLVGSAAEFERLLGRECAQNEHHAVVLRALYTFNQLVLRTNFYMSTKVALLFRLDPLFLPRSEYPETPYGMFFVVGSDFRGFHIRFRDIARGGIRVVRLRLADAYNVNVRNLFDENYNLASTQQRKNKDIPEGGSKGVILLDPGAAQETPRAAFEKYIDALIDLLLTSAVPGKEACVDLYKKPEILFMGPDEGTAGYVDWAALHARARGAPWWRSFFTGKLQLIGGIPHDEYGMTTLLVRLYTNKIYEKLGVDPALVRKVQTGGPDGDLGLNEIKLLRTEQYVGIVDGLGVLADPRGLDKAELLRLAGARQMIDHYDRLKLSPEGFVVLVDDVDVTLPNGSTVALGVGFRNTFHEKIGEVFGLIDLFVPCGGRPGALDVLNIGSLIRDGRAIVPYFVEGANLFITQLAKLELEQAGCIVFKDASTNKGGVTSSSLEVLAALAFDDEGFLQHMCIGADSAKPPFYERYVEAVQARIVLNAEAEFEALWALKAATGTPITELLDQLSLAINKLADELANSNELWSDDALFRNAVLQDALPPLLLEEIGLPHILQRVPESYLKALFATRLAARFVYLRGVDLNPAKFLEFISLIRREYTERKLL